MSGGPRNPRWAEITHPHEYTPTYAERENERDTGEKERPILQDTSGVIWSNTGSDHRLVWVKVVLDERCHRKRKLGTGISLSVHLRNPYDVRLGASLAVWMTSGVAGRWS